MLLTVLKNFIKKYKKIFLLILDVFLISLAVFLAFFLRFEGQIPQQHFPNIWGMTALTLIFCLSLFHIFKLYSFSWTYISTTELISLFKATFLAFLLLGASLFFFKQHPIFAGFPRSTLFISLVLIIIFCGGVRFLKRVYLQIILEKPKKGKEKTLIVGAGDAGEQILRNILSSKSSPFYPVGFADDDSAKQGVLIHGFKVLGKIEDIPDIVARTKVKGIIVALPSAGTAAIKRAVEKAREGGLRKIKIVPSAVEIINGKISINNLKNPQMEDLLQRKPVSLDYKSLENFIKNKAVLITGAAGSIGSELSKQVAKFSPSSLLALDQDETGIFNLLEDLKDKFPQLNVISLIADITDQNKINQIFNKFQPQLVFHAAAYKHVPLMEIHPDQAVKNNILGTKIVAEGAVKSGVEKLIFISTDKSVNPTSVMGATKRVGEMIGQALNSPATKFISVRFGNVLDSRGSVIPIFREQIKKREPIPITHPEMKRYFMITSEACLLVMQAGVMGEGGEVFVLDMGDPILIVDLAKEMIRLSGLEPDKDIPIIYTEPRPGEKFSEEILTAEEGVVPTQHQKIFMANLSEVNKSLLNSNLEKLKQASEIEDKETIKKILKELIPTYG